MPSAWALFAFVSTSSFPHHPSSGSTHTRRRIASNPISFIRAVHSVSAPAALRNFCPSLSIWVAQLMSAPSAKPFFLISAGFSGSGCGRGSSMSFPHDIDVMAAAAKNIYAFSLMNRMVFISYKYSKDFGFLINFVCR